MTAVVLAYRCGAVPDSHRVPSYDAPSCASRGRTIRNVSIGSHQFRIVPGCQLKNELGELQALAGE
jgi:hypothetical protein